MDGEERADRDAESGSPMQSAAGEPSKRLACPVCGSTRTQPFLHAGPAARVNMKCNDCGNLFKDPHLRR